MSDPIRLYLVRHGQATGGWDEDPDPGLSALGREQAAAVAGALDAYGPLPLVTSPMRRTQETASAFAARWSSQPVSLQPKIDPRVSEIPSPTPNLDIRRAWLSEVMAGAWSDPAAQKAGEHDLGVWRSDLVAALSEIDESTVITSHFVAINVVVGHILGDDRVVCFRPDNCSVTVIDKDGSDFRLIELGVEAETEIG